MARKPTVFVLFDRFTSPEYYHVRRARDKTKTLCNKEILPGETCTVKRPKNLEICGMCKSLLGFSKSGMPTAKRGLARRRRT